MTLSTYIGHEVHVWDGAVKDTSRTGDIVPNWVTFVSVLTKKSGTFEIGQVITQWYKLWDPKNSHSEEFRFSLTTGDYGSTIDTTLTQTCEKPSLYGQSTVTWSDEQCPWISDDKHWSLTEDTVTASVKRELILFKEINLYEPYLLQGGYIISPNASSLSQDSGPSGTSE